MVKKTHTMVLLNGFHLMMGGGSLTHEFHSLCQYKLLSYCGIVFWSLLLVGKSCRYLGLYFVILFNGSGVAHTRLK